jgi:fimbrial chaperone protein
MRNILLIGITAILISICGDANAFRFSPFRSKFEPSGAEANKLFLVENNTDEPVSVQIRVTTREVDSKGVEKNADSKDFVIYPEQVILKPHTNRSVRVQWAGDASLKDEKAYRIIAEQLPVNLNKEKPKNSAVKFLTSYRGALFVTPDGLSHDVKLESYKLKGKSLELVMNNQGTQHALLRNLKLELTDDKGKTVTLAGDKQLKDVTGEGILAGHKREFNVPAPAGIGNIKSVNFTFDKDAF